MKYMYISVAARVPPPALLEAKLSVYQFPKQMPLPLFIF